MDKHIIIILMVLLAANFASAEIIQVIEMDFVTIGNTGNAADSTDLPDDMQAIKKVFDEWFKACRDKDFELAKTMLHPEAADTAPRHIEATSKLLDMSENKPLLIVAVIQKQDSAIVGAETKGGLFFQGQQILIAANLKKYQEKWRIHVISANKIEMLKQFIAHTKEKTPDAVIWLSDSYSSIETEIDAAIREKQEMVSSVGKDPSAIALLYHRDRDVRIHAVRAFASTNDPKLIDDIIRARSTENYTPVHNEYNKTLGKITGKKDRLTKGEWKAWLISEVKASRLKIDYIPIKAAPEHQGSILPFATSDPNDFTEMADALTSEYNRSKCNVALKYMVMNDHLEKVQQFLAGDWLSKHFANKKININDVAYNLNALANPGTLRDHINRQVHDCLNSNNPAVVANALNLIAGVKGFTTRFTVPDVKDNVREHLTCKIPEIAEQAQRAMKRIDPSWEQNIPARPQKAKGPLQLLIDAAKSGDTVIVPKGTYSESLAVSKSLTLKGKSKNDCIVEVTGNVPAVFIDTKGTGNVKIEGLTIKWQLATSDRIENPYAIVVKDSQTELSNCVFLPLGNFKRSPTAVKAIGFSMLDVNTCRFEGFGYPVFYGEATEGSVRDSVIANCQSQGITLFSGAKVEIAGNIITGSKKHAVRNTGGTLNMHGNLIVGNANRGVYLGNKSASGNITNNIIMNNGTGISGFARSNVKIENNLLLSNDFAGIDMRDSCTFSIRNNIIEGNTRGLAIFKETGENKNTIHANTFWQNEADTQDCQKLPDSIEADPMFADASNGDFFLKTGPASKQKHGLTNPEALKKLWKYWKSQTTNSTVPVTVIDIMLDHKLENASLDVKLSLTVRGKKVIEEVERSDQEENI